jgi:hypothetical protein
MMNIKKANIFRCKAIITIMRTLIRIMIQIKVTPVS